MAHSRCDLLKTLVITVGAARRQRKLTTMLLVALLTLAACYTRPQGTLDGLRVTQAHAPVLVTARTEHNALNAYGKLQLAFVPNAGQADPRVRYSAQAGGASFYFTPDEAVFAFANERQGHVLRLAFLDSNPLAEITGARPGTGRINYLIGSDPTLWRTGLPTYGEVIYRDLWPGIDLAFRGEKGELKYEFRLAPGADPRDISLAYLGAEQLSLSRDGELFIHTSLGVIHDSRPVSYQMIAGRRVSVASQYSLAPSSYGFALGAYDPSLPLVIDPGLAYSTYLGGSLSDQGLGIAVDASGSAYITGVTGASNFPTTVGAFDQTFNGGSGDVFVTKLNPTGNALVYSTYLGGSANDQGNAIGIDSAGNAYVTGWTDSSDFPTTPGAFHPSDYSGRDAFVTKLDATGSSLVYSTYLGGSLPGVLCSPSPCPDEEGTGIAVDAVGNAYVTGWTRSRDFATTPGAFDTAYTNGSGSTVFVTKLDSNGSALIYSTYLGESGRGNAIAVAADGCAYVTGNASSTSFPTTPGAFDTTGSGSDAFVTKFNTDGSGLLYSTFLSGSLGESGNGIAVDVAGNAYVAGFSDSADYPTTPGAFDTTIPAAHIGQVFVTKLNADGSALIYSTYLGGSGNDICFGVAIDAAGNACVTGQTTSANFPTTPGAFDTTYNTGTASDVFLTKFNATGSALLYSTYLGGAVSETGRGIATDSFGSVYVTGVSASNNFPITPGAFDTTFNGGADAFVIKFGNQPPDATADAATTDEDNAVTVSVLANDSDPDGDPIILSGVTQGANGSVTINPDKTVTYSPEANFYGTDSFTYTAVDSWGDTDTATVAITINPVNDPPVADDLGAATDEDISIQINLAATDVDNSNLTFAVVSGPASGTLGPVSGASLTYTPNLNYNGPDSFTFKANDGMADSNIATVSITVEPVNDPPDAIDDAASTSEEMAVTINVRSNDTDVEDNILIIIAVSQAEHGSVAITADGTAVSYTPAPDFFGTDSFAYTISDGNGGTDTATVNLTIINVQDAPSANDDAATVSEDSGANTINILANDFDVDGNSLAVASVTQGAHGTVVNNGSSVSYTPSPNYFGPDSFTYTVSDGQGGSDTASVSVTVINVNDAPTASDDSYSTNTNTTLVVSAPGVLSNDADIDGDALSAVLVTNVSNGTLTLAANGSFTYTPNLNFSGADSFTYRAFDQAANSNVVTVRINIIFNLIAFSSARDGNSEIYSMSIDGSGQTRLTNHSADDLFPAWSPDMKKIAFSSNRDGSFEIFVMNADGSSPARLTTNALIDGALAWSPDGTKIAFSSNRDGNPEIYVMNADGTGLTRLTKNRAIDTKPSWSPDGAKIAFSSDRKRSFEIYVMNADGSGLTQLTKNGFTDVGAAWSPDGVKIAFASDRDGNFEIYLMNADGSGQTRLTTNAAVDREPAWSRDGLKIIFTSQRDGNAEVYLMNPDGSGQTRLTMNPAADTSPD